MYINAWDLYLNARSRRFPIYYSTDMRSFTFLGILFFFSIISICQGQDFDTNPDLRAKKYYLLLQKPGKVFRYRFFEGAPITLQLVGDKKFYTGRITGIQEKIFVFLGTDVTPAQVAQIRLQNHTPGRNLAWVSSAFLRKGGGFFTLIGAFYAVLSDRQDGLITMGLGAAAFTLGKGVQVFQKRSYKAHQGWVLLVI
jgi:hypothetical protein